MNITPQKLARRIREAREACGLTQEALATALGLSRSAVVQIERAKRQVSSLEMDRLARVLGRDLRDFFRPEFNVDDAVVALFRAEKDAPDHEAVLDQLRHCAALGRELTNLEDLLGLTRELPTAARYERPAPSALWEAIRQGEAVAEEERRRLGLGSAPLPDLAELLESQGVRTAVVLLPDDVSGITLSDARVGLFVISNAGHHRWRRRFSFAHEYAHVLLDRNRQGLISRASRKQELHEVRANSFAAAFLMPEAAVRAFVARLGKGAPSRRHAEVYDDDEVVPVDARSEPHSQDVQMYDVVHLAHTFGVSRLSAIYRLQNLKLLTTKQAETLRIQDVAGHGKRIARALDLPDPPDEDGPNQFRHWFLAFALEAYRRSKITLGKLKELGAMVEMNGSDIDALLADIGFPDEDTEAPVLLPDV